GRNGPATGKRNATRYVLVFSGKFRRWPAAPVRQKRKGFIAADDLPQEQAGGALGCAIFPTGGSRSPLPFPDDSAHLASCAAVVGGVDSSSSLAGISSSDYRLSDPAAGERNRSSRCPRRRLGRHSLACDPHGRSADPERVASRRHAMGSNHPVGPRPGPHHVARSRQVYWGGSGLLRISRVLRSSISCTIGG